MEAGLDVPFLDAKEESSDMIAYRTQAPPVISLIESTQIMPEKEPSVVAPFSAVDISAMRRRLSELEDEIERLQSRDVAGEDESDQRIAELEHLLEEKRDSEASLLSMLEEFQARLDQQRLLINQLMKRMDIQKFKTQS
jgi:hypothetical protein